MLLFYNERLLALIRNIISYFFAIIGKVFPFRRLCPSWNLQGFPVKTDFSVQRIQYPKAFNLLRSATSQIG